MIVVIADDISGAAEIASVALKFGLRAQVQTRFDLQAPVDLIAIDTDTRNFTAQEAGERLTNLSELLSQIQVDGYYKKVDSVLRGHVHTECTALMTGLKRKRTLLIPANPSKGRTIQQGQYWIEGHPLHQTGFAHDPEYPATTSDVATLLQGPINLATRNPNALPDQGLIVGNTNDQQDIDHWAAQIDSDTLAAGAIDFFTAWMQRQYPCHSTPSIASPPGNRLIVCGSASEQSRQAIEHAQAQGCPVIAMPGLLSQTPQQPDESLIQGWAADIVAALSQQGHAITHIPGPIRPDAASPLKDLMARLAQEVKHKIDVTEWVIEGGATARAILDRLAWHTLDIQGLYAPGVVQMQVAECPDIWVTLKPGSYPWPLDWWKRRK